MALYEVLPVTDDIREPVLVGASALEIRRRALSLGMKTLRTTGLAKAGQGMTTVEEILRVTIGE